MYVFKFDCTSFHLDYKGLTELWESVYRCFIANIVQNVITINMLYIYSSHNLIGFEAVPQSHLHLLCVVLLHTVVQYKNH